MTPHHGPISIEDAVQRLDEAWKPVDIASANNTMLRLARLDGPFEWHAHDEDELFLCWQGSFRIELEAADAVALERGDVFVVPRDTRHRPVADSGAAYTLLVESPQTLQYGDARAEG
ncbi:MAG: cupin domain-containing protein [Candidatus Limnocylindria bacterium]